MVLTTQNGVQLTDISTYRLNCPFSENWMSIFSPVEYNILWNREGSGLVTTFPSASRSSPWAPLPWSAPPPRPSLDDPSHSSYPPEEQYHSYFKPLWFRVKKSGWGKCDKMPGMCKLGWEKYEKFWIMSSVWAVREEKFWMSIVLNKVFWMIEFMKKYSVA